MSTVCVHKSMKRKIEQNRCRDKYGEIIEREGIDIHAYKLNVETHERHNKWV